MSLFRFHLAAGLALAVAVVFLAPSTVHAVNGNRLQIAQGGPLTPQQIQQQLQQRIKLTTDQGRRVKAAEKPAKDLDGLIRDLQKEIAEEKRKVAAMKDAKDRAARQKQLDDLASKATVTVKWHRAFVAQMSKTLSAAQAAEKAKDIAAATKAHADLMAEKAKLDSLGDMSQKTMLDLQQTMQRQQQAMQTLSNIMKKMHDTQKSIISNLKG